jgi:hypothetical protein
MMDWNGNRSLKIGTKTKKRGTDMTYNKYRNTRVVVDGIEFDSIKEAKRYGTLKILQKAGEISDLKLQVRMDILVNSKKIAAYIADFTYMEKGHYVVEDVKSEFTRKNPVYRLKKKLIEAIYNLKIKEV